jgi:hypothetical protein
MAKESGPDTGVAAAGEPVFQAQVLVWVLVFALVLVRGEGLRYLEGAVVAPTYEAALRRAGRLGDERLVERCHRIRSS